jgi:hypothetical protein
MRRAAQSVPWPTLPLARESRSTGEHCLSQRLAECPRGYADVPYPL